MSPTMGEGAPVGNIKPLEILSTSFRKIERHEWWLWSAAVCVRALLGLVLIFNIYTLYQQLQIQRIRRKLVQREELFRLISENAADLIAVVDMHGNRIYSSLSYEKVLGYTAEELRNSSSFEQI